MKSNFEIEVVGFGNCKVKHVVNGLMIVHRESGFNSDNKYGIIVANGRELIARFSDYSSAETSVNILISISEVWTMTPIKWYDLPREDFFRMQCESQSIKKYLKEIDPELHTKRYENGLKELREEW